MPYHLNIFHAGSHESSIDLDDLLGKLNERYPGAGSIQRHKTISEISIPNFSIGKLYFKNGLLWSIYESENQLKKLVDFFTDFNFEIVGEEGEIYDQNNPDRIKRETRLLNSGDKLHEWFKQFFSRHILSLICISIIVLVGMILLN